MFNRKLYSYYKDVNAKILVIDGTRQIGKSYIIKKTAKKILKIILKLI